MADWFVLGFAIASIPLYIFGLIGNTMVIRIVHKTREMHTTTNYLLANLAVSDAITIFTIPMMYFAYGGDFDKFSENLVKFSCKFVVVGTVATASSTSTLTVIAVERYHAILKPFNSNLRLNERSIKKAIVFIWIISILVGFPGFFLNVYDDEQTYCGGPFGSELNLEGKIYLIIYFIFIIYIPIIVFLFCYGSLIKGLYFSNDICAESTNEDTSEKKKLLMTFILATSGFLLGYGPLTVLYTTISLGKKIDRSLIEKLNGALLFLFVISLCLNPVLYAFRSSSFKEGFKRIFNPVLRRLWNTMRINT